MLYQLALTAVPQVGCVHARALVDHFGEAEKIFKSSVSTLERIEGIGTTRARNIKSFTGFKRAEKEIQFIEKHKIQALFIKDSSYPKRLLNCFDPPTLLFYRGDANLNESRTVSIIGTRSFSEYGKQLTDQLVSSLKGKNILVLSGLAFGIDALAHRNCIKNNIDTVGVLAHGLDTIYPSQHSSLAKEMIKSGGGVLTEFPSNTKPDRHNFPSRNRIVAGMSDATIVIESGVKGGSMVTAELANGYNKDVFAFPGRIYDSKSGGCNLLIKNNKAVLLTEPGDLLQLMGWNEESLPKRKQQRELFLSLSSEEQKIVELLAEKELAEIDELNQLAGLSVATVAAALLNLELQNIVGSLPGKRYKLL